MADPKKNEFEEIVEEVVASIPRRFLGKLNNVTIIVEDFPNPYQLKKLRLRGERTLLLGLYEGVPQTKRRHYGVGGSLPDKITIFQGPIQAIAHTKYDLIQIVKKTVIHEIAHHFGMDETAVRAAEKQKIKRVWKKESLLHKKKIS